MQSLQMRCPVPAAIGLSIVVMASAPTEYPFCLTQIHLGDFFVERAARERNSENAEFELAGFFLEAGGATIPCPGYGT